MFEPRQYHQKNFYKKAGGTLVILGLTLKKKENHKANFIGIGMHGGVIYLRYLRGKAETFQFGQEVGIVEMNEEDSHTLKELLKEYSDFSMSRLRK